MVKVRVFLMCIMLAVFATSTLPSCFASRPLQNPTVKLDDIDGAVGVANKDRAVAASNIEHEEIWDEATEIDEFCFENLKEDSNNVDARDFLSDCRRSLASRFDYTPSSPRASANTNRQSAGRH